MIIILAASFVVLVVYVALVHRDLARLRSTNDAACFVARTSIGRLAAGIARSREKEIHARDWQIGILQDAGSGIQSDDLFDALVPLKDQDSDDLLSFYKGVLSYTQRRFRSSACAVLFRSAQGDQRSTFISLGLVGKRFESRFRAELTSSLARGYESEAPDFSDFGCAHSLVEHIRLNEEQSGAEQTHAILWLGYGSDRSPSAFERTMVADLGVRVTSELKRLSALQVHVRRADAAESKETSKDEFIAQMSHDLRSPLNNVRSILNLLKAENTKDEDCELYDSALSNCDELSNLVEDVLDFSKHRAGKLAPRMEQFDLISILQAVVQSYAVTARRKGLELQLEGDIHGAVCVDADKTQIRRIFHNLVSNAIKYTPRGSVRIEVIIDPARQVAVKVRDTGVGMSAYELKHLFTPFSRFGSSNAEGAGLGLAITKILVEQNSGGLTVDSWEREGSEFQVVFPIVSGQSVSEKPSNSSVGMQARQTAVSVLIVDDDFESALSLARYLRLEGIAAEAASSVDDAISLMNFDAPDFVITDLSMPGGGGRKILEFAAAQNTGVIILTGNPDGGVMQELQARGAIKVFQKPCDPGDLIGVLVGPRKSACG